MSVFGKTSFKYKGLKCIERSSSKCNGNTSSKNVLRNEEPESTPGGLPFPLKMYLGRHTWTEPTFNLKDKMCVHIVAWTYLMSFLAACEEW